MPFPLYRNIQAPDKPAHSTMNMGLWFERFFSGYQTSFDKVDENTRAEWLRSCTTRKLGSQTQLYNKALALQLLGKNRQGQARIYLCEGSFVTGLGNPHPAQNGFLWHPTLGVPYLPGCAVKGLVRALVETAYEGMDKDEVLKRWFGTVNKGDVAEQSGQLVFMDALPVTPCEIVTEIMTPHMDKWYEKGGKNPLHKDTQPGDWHSPIPVSYLVARNLRLQFLILPRIPSASTADSENMLTDVWEALDKALDWLGAGAKTAIGFGQFRRDENWENNLNKHVNEQQKKLQEQAIKACASPLQLKTMEFEDFLKEIKGISAGDSRMATFWQRLGNLINFCKEKSSVEEKLQLHNDIKQWIKSYVIPISSKKEKDYKFLINELLKK